MKTFFQESPALHLENLNLTTDEVLDIVSPSYQHFAYKGNIYKSRLIEVAPQLARFLLTKNVSNRPLSRSNINYLKQQVLSGNWTFSGEPIQIDSDGNLLNGQHRLTVIVELDRPLVLLVISGFNNEIFTVLDTGRKRQGSDTLAIMEVENASLVAAAVRIVNQVKGNVYNDVPGADYRGLSNHAIAKFVNEHPRIIESGKIGMSLYKQCDKTLSPSVIGAFHYLLTEIEATDGYTFLHQVCTGLGLEANSPTNALRRRLLSLKDEKSKTVLQSEIIKLITYSWNKYRAGEKCKTLKVPNEPVELSF